MVMTINQHQVEQSRESVGEFNSNKEDFTAGVKKFTL